MKYSEFVNKVRAAVEEKLQGSCKVELKEMRKNNGVMLQALLIAPEGECVIPTIYLESFYKAYEEGMTFSEVIREILETYQRGMPSRSVDMEFYDNFDAVKDRICYRLIQKCGNEELLREIPFVEFLDLAICFYYAYHDDVLGEGSILVYLTHSKKWKVSAQQLLDLAIDNTQRLFPEKIFTMGDLLAESGMEVTDREEIEHTMGDDSAAGRFFMTVLTNERKNHGAVSMLYPDVLDRFSENLEEGFYIIPSSIHEVILMNGNSLVDTDQLKRTIYEVNRSQLSPEEVLSDNLYYYSKNEKTVSIV